jgi:hypothetical protein
MAPSPKGLGLLLADADSRAPALSQRLREKNSQQQNALSRGPLPKLLWNEGGDASSLVQQRWGVIAPEGDVGDALIDRVAPLIEQRKRQQGDHPVAIYRAPAKASDTEAALWRKQHFDTGKDTRETLPRYQLILGNLDQVPLSIQQAQSIDGFVGRLAFDDPEGYRAYADKVLRYENGPQQKQPARTVFHTVHDGTDATKLGYQALMAPGLAMTKRKVLERKVQASAVLEAGDQAAPSRDELLRSGAGTDLAVLFSLSHGSGAPRRGWKSAADQRRRQGGLVFPDGLLLGSDVAAQPFLPGGIWFLFACFGAGTPETSSYHHWLKSLRESGELSEDIDVVLRSLLPPGERPFIAALPQAVLSSTDGPLAVIGHIDLAWSYSFSELDTGEQVDRPARFVQIVTDLLRGDRVGTAFRSLMLALGATNSELATIYDRMARSSGLAPNPKLDARRAYLWMQRQDLAGYILLGDPAARLPLTPPVAAGGEAGLGLAPVLPAIRSSQLSEPSAADPLRMLEAQVGSAASSEQRRDAREKAIAELILDPGRAAALAGSLALSDDELRAIAARYRQAGRATLR